MLIIRSAQLRAMGGEENFVQALHESLQDGGEAAPDGRPSEAQVRHAVEEARNRGISRECDVARYAAIVASGPAGSRPPARLEKLLRAGQVPAAERLERAEQWLRRSGRPVPSAPAEFSTKKVGDPVYPCPLRKDATPPLHWIEIVLIGEDDAPVGWEEYLITAPGLDPVSGLLNEEGFARVEGLPSGADAKVSFPRLDKEAWEPLAAVHGTREAPAEGGNTQKVVDEGDSLSSIGFEFGFFPDTLWELGENAALAKQRDEPDALMPRDIVVIPPLRLKEVTVPVDKRHRFRRLGVPAIFEIQLFLGERPRASEPYILLVDGQERRGTTDENGNLREWVPPDIKEGELSVGSQATRYAIQFGYLDPADEISGIQQRLRNLGFIVEDPEGTMGESTAGALRAFQWRLQLNVTGIADADTVRKLEWMHDDVSRYPELPPPPMPPPDEPEPVSSGRGNPATLVFYDPSMELFD
ncbi:MAG: peptidoglycan-binding domain-containing protein [Candidatus Solibacter sp.]|nr:peptidoglycan-binding domain-containing protein [Candidatus Solibacter sp.]